MSREYAKIYCTFWQNPDLISCSQDAKLIAIYLETCSHGNIIGCFRIHPAYIAADLNMGIETVSKGLSELSSKGLITLCEHYSIVLLKGFFRNNKLENKNQCIAAVKRANEIPDDCLVIPELAKLLNEQFRKLEDKDFETLWDTLSEPLRDPHETSNNNKSNCFVINNNNSGYPQSYSQIDRKSDSAFYKLKYAKLFNNTHLHTIVTALELYKIYDIKKAALIADQISYAIHQLHLFNKSKNMPNKINAALKLVREGRWTEPNGYDGAETVIRIMSDYVQ